MVSFLSQRVSLISLFILVGTLRRSIIYLNLQSMQFNLPLNYQHIINARSADIIFIY